MRFGFVTCVQLGLSCMQAIYECGGSLDLAITLPDDMARQKSGRVYIDGFCSAHGVPLVKARNVNDDAVIEAIKARELDWLFVIGWSQIARKPLLDAPRLGVLGMHPTLLPQGRGRAAIPWAILLGLEKTGVTLFKLDEGTDTGNILAQVEIPLTDSTDATELYAAVDAAHVALMKAAFPGLRDGTIELRPQEESGASEWPGRSPADGKIDLSGSIADAECLVRAVTRPYPGAFAEVDGRKLIVWKARVAQPGTAAPDAVLLPFRDGQLECLEYEYEADHVDNPRP